MWEKVFKCVFFTFEKRSLFLTGLLRKLQTVFGFKISQNLRKSLEEGNLKDLQLYDRSISLKMEVVLLVADLPARASFKEMSQLDAFFGCKLCLVEAKTIGSIPFYHHQDSPMRDPETHKRHIEHRLDLPPCLNF